VSAVRDGAEHRLYVVGLVPNLRMCEPQADQAGGGVGLVADPVGGLLCRCTVVLKPVRLDDEAQVRPVEVDLEAVEPALGLRPAEPCPQRDRDEQPLELGLGHPKGAPVEDLSQQRRPRPAGVVVEPDPQLRDGDHVQAIGGIHGRLDLVAVVPGGEVDEGDDWSGDADRPVHPDVPGLQGAAAVDGDAAAARVRV
jgi:hypothetical protein